MNTVQLQDTPFRSFSSPCCGAIHIEFHENCQSESIITKYHAIKAYWGVEVQINAFLTSLPRRFMYWVTAPSTHGVEGWVGPRAGLDTVAKRKDLNIAPTGNRTPVIRPVAQ
jgi:hypothetical protein